MGFWEAIIGMNYFCGTCRGLGFHTLEYMHSRLYVVVGWERVLHYSNLGVIEHSIKPKLTHHNHWSLETSNRRFLWKSWPLWW